MSWVDPLKDGKSRIELIAALGSDLDIVNDARASFEKTATELSDKDIKLIYYLIKHEHTSPFRGTVFKFKVKAPLFVCRQWWKHVIASNHNDEQLGWNEKSFRYVEIDDSSEFYIPKIFRQQSKNNKQATEGQLAENANQKAIAIYTQQCQTSYEAYRTLLELGVGREQARGVLVPSVYTSWVWTVSLQAVLHFIGLRRGAGAQSEIGAYAQAITSLIKPIVPVSIEAWETHHNHL
ncbi:FAD-dependent thymidylate synthase [Umezakia ovalisporum]|uniref:FAD-dependent thymidylate synthase n=2 Tax=Umezakia ovalisporum TaxID=75695 RepID=A0AA43GXB1_9CYAN|nr:FAD-dependent thymidylate synthase [Umezakia ovalisporum]MDH6057571.1 FAD-dependent thymidylate synthase [Umezakia ovalisporum FSS-43]MDH6063454.1 FAD-dependent thymidylate synthase [Umezakia ovalisporum FSS-62]MDH6066482.1 FAD-dependent thymidylate synthase [Umezakia ovalisporum APH033B]MDH6072379.1 FAD-dependent thymidylate synthase [Umezakia ovalisporum CobakiLakeA]MDH6075839.1 FAD-dependent thymidylate synthase [Umezakia ovalisporum CS-1034]